MMSKTIYEKAEQRKEMEEARRRMRLEDVRLMGRTMLVEPASSVLWIA